jgi:hypothetical protein
LRSFPTLSDAPLELVPSERPAGPELVGPRPRARVHR